MLTVPQKVLLAATFWLCRQDICAHLILGQSYYPLVTITSVLYVFARAHTTMERHTIAGWTPAVVGLISARGHNGWNQIGRELRDAGKTCYLCLPEKDSSSERI